VKDGHTVFMISGAVIDQGVFKIDGKNLASIDWSGGFMKLLWTGTDTLGAAITDTSTTTVTPAIIDSNDGKPALYSVGSIFTIDSERMKVSSVNANGTLTVERGYGSTTPATHLISTEMVPWLPSGTTVGNPVHGRLGIATLDAANYNILTSEITIANNYKFYEEEKNGDNYPSDFGAPEFRTVDGRVTVYFRAAAGQRFKDALDFNVLAFTLPAGDTAGSIFTLNLPQLHIEAPDITGDMERIQELTLKPHATSSNDDEVNVVYT
jgi:hypothetical protein